MRTAVVLDGMDKDLIRQEKEKGKVILITTHIMSFVDDIADEIIFLLEGKIYFRGSLEELKAQYNETNVERAIARILQGEPKVSANGKSKTLPKGKPFKILV